MVKIVLIDDETFVLRGLTHLLTKQQVVPVDVCASFENGLEALAFIRQNDVDLVITDIRMPYVTGIELIPLIKKINPNIHIIALSAYSDFEYVRKSMVGGASDYLLKPCKNSDVCSLLEKVEQNKRVMTNRNQYQDNQKQLALYLDGYPAAINDLKTGDDVVMTVIMTTESRNMQYVQDLIAQQPSGLGCGDFKYTFYREQIVIVYPDEKKNETQVMDFYRNTERKRVDLFMAMANSKFDLHQIREKYEICKKMIDFLRFNKIRAPIHLDAFHKYLEQIPDSNFSMLFNVDAIVKYILANDSVKANAYIRQIANSLIQRSTFFDPERLKKEVLDQVFQVEKMLVEATHNEDTSDSFVEVMTQINDSASFDELIRTLSGFFTNISIKIESAKDIPRYIKSAITYLENNYMHDISLHDVAEQVYLNPWYFSSQFKKHIGCPMSEYLNHLRIKKAKELLKQVDLKIYQISEMVGFSDPAYFSTVFKYSEKMTPREYQKKGV